MIRVLVFLNFPNHSVTLCSTAVALYEEKERITLSVNFLFYAKLVQILRSLHLFTHSVELFKRLEPLHYRHTNTINNSKVMNRRENSLYLCKQRLRNTRRRNMSEIVKCASDSHAMTFRRPFVAVFEYGGIAIKRKHLYIDLRNGLDKKGRGGGLIGAVS